MRTLKQKQSLPLQIKEKEQASQAGLGHHVQVHIVRIVRTYPARIAVPRSEKHVQRVLRKIVKMFLPDVGAARESIFIQGG
jgi:hypothetical protein